MKDQNMNCSCPPILPYKKLVNGLKRILRNGYRTKETMKDYTNRTLASLRHEFLGTNKDHQETSFFTIEERSYYSKGEWDKIIRELQPRKPIDKLSHPIARLLRSGEESMRAVGLELLESQYSADPVAREIREDLSELFSWLVENDHSYEMMADMFALEFSHHQIKNVPFGVNYLGALTVIEFSGSRLCVDTIDVPSLESFEYTGKSLFVKELNLPDLSNLYINCIGPIKIKNFHLPKLNKLYLWSTLYQGQDAIDKLNAMK